jgi:hypothetical protein
VISSAQPAEACHTFLIVQFLHPGRSRSGLPGCDPFLASGQSVSRMAFCDFLIARSNLPFHREFG